LRLSDFRDARGRQTSILEQVTMKNSMKTAGVRVKSGVKAGAVGGYNHNAAIRVKSGIKAGAVGGYNHNTVIRVKPGTVSGQTTARP
jgi:hypothetical protein